MVLNVRRNEDSKIIECQMEFEPTTRSRRVVGQSNPIWDSSLYFSLHLILSQIMISGIKVLNLRWPLGEIIDSQF